MEMSRRYNQPLTVHLVGGKTWQTAMSVSHQILPMRLALPCADYSTGIILSNPPTVFCDLKKKKSIVPKHSEPNRGSECVNNLHNSLFLVSGGAKIQMQVPLHTTPYYSLPSTPEASKPAAYQGYFGTGEITKADTQQHCPPSLPPSFRKKRRESILPSSLYREQFELGVGSLAVPFPIFFPNQIWTGVFGAQSQ